MVTLVTFMKATACRQHANSEDCIRALNTIFKKPFHMLCYIRNMIVTTDTQVLSL